MSLILYNGISKFYDCILHDVFVSVFDVVLSSLDVATTLLNEVKPHENLGENRILFFKVDFQVVCVSNECAIHGLGIQWKVLLSFFS